MQVEAKLRKTGLD